MNEAAKEARRAYKRKWNREHPDKVKQYQANYWNRKAQEAAAAGGDLVSDSAADPAQEG